jgi:hypothetical protein
MKETWFCAVRESLWRRTRAGVARATAATGRCPAAAGGTEPVVHALGLAVPAPRSRRTNDHSAAHVQLSARGPRRPACPHAVRATARIASPESAIGA